MPEVRGAVGKAAAALALLALLSSMSLVHVYAESLPPQVYMLAAAVELYTLNGDIKDASTYSTLLCQVLAALPPGRLNGNSNEAYQLAYLASVRTYAPGYLDYRLMQLVYAHLTDGASLDPRDCGSAAPPASQPPSSALSRMIEQAVQQGKSYEDAYKSAESIASKSIIQSAGKPPVSLKFNETRVPPPPETLEAERSLQKRGFNITSLARILSKLRGLNASGIIRPGTINVAATPNTIDILRFLRGGGSRASLNLAALRGANLSLGGFNAPLNMPSIGVPRLPSFTLPGGLPGGIAVVPPIDPRLLAVVAAFMGVVVLLWRSREIASTLKMRVLRARIARAAERGDIDALIEAFAALLEEIGERCRPKAPDETHREYASVLRGQALREYLRAALAYEAAKFGGKLDRREAARVVREAAEKLARRIECSGGGG